MPLPNNNLPDKTFQAAAHFLLIFLVFACTPPDAQPEANDKDAEICATPPSTPVDNLQVVGKISNYKVLLEWSFLDDTCIDHYDIIRSEGFAASITQALNAVTAGTSSENQFIDTLDTAGTYSYFVIGKTPNGLSSPATTPITISVDALGNGSLAYPPGFFETALLGLFVNEGESFPNTSIELSYLDFAIGENGMYKVARSAGFGNLMEGIYPSGKCYTPWFVNDGTFVASNGQLEMHISELGPDLYDYTLYASELTLYYSPLGGESPEVFVRQPNSRLSDTTECFGPYGATSLQSQTDVTASIAVNVGTAGSPGNPNDSVDQIIVSCWPSSCSSGLQSQNYVGDGNYYFDFSIDLTTYISCSLDTFISTVGGLYYHLDSVQIDRQFP